MPGRSKRRAVRLGAVLIRVAEAEELKVLPDLEVAAGQLFADFGMPEVAAYHPPAVESLARYQEMGLLWVAVEDEVLGYLMAEQVDGCLHIDQVSVAPRHGRRGIGAALIEQAAGTAAAQGFPALTLTTFVEVPWNGPYYERLGFRRLAEDKLTDGLRQIRAHEARIGLDAWPRCGMRKEIG